MLIRQIALLSKTPNVPLEALMRVSAALQRQVTRDFYPIWNVQATVDGFASEADVPPGYWKVTVMDKIPEKNAGGFHLDKQGQPYADVLFSPDWSLAASHECLEMLVDPFGHQTASGPSPKKGQGRVNFLVEVCDPCEANAFAYKINTDSAHEVLVSDFYTPDYFAPTRSLGVRYDFQGSISAPRQVLTGGYCSWSNPRDGRIWQQFGPVGLGHFVDNGPGTLNREHTDKHAREARGKRFKPLTADLSGKCNLTSDPVTGVLHGTAGNQTTIQIKDSTGTAIFKTFAYGDKQIGKDTASVDLAIVAGNQDISYVYAAPVPGDTIGIVDPCGNLLDSFGNDPGNPFGRQTVVA